MKGDTGSKTREPFEINEYKALRFYSIIPFQYQLAVDVALTWDKFRDKQIYNKLVSKGYTIFACSTQPSSRRP